MVRCGLVQRRTDVHSVLEPFVPDVGMLHVGSAVSVPFLVAFRFGFVCRLESRIVSLRCGLEMGCLPILDCEHVTFGGDSDTPSRLGIREQFFGLGHSVSLPLPQPVRV